MNNSTLAHLPLCIDLDGTLVRSDTLVEGAFLLLKKNLFFIFLMPLWLLRGKANLKAQIAARVSLDVEHLPYNLFVLERIAEHKQAGGSVYLATAADARYAHAIAEHLGVFDDTFASDGQTNLSGQRKGDRMAERFGEKGFIYAGNDAVDLKIWSRAAHALVVDAPSAVRKKAARLELPQEEIRSRTLSLKTYLRAIRIHQWLKNSLIFVPLFTAHMFTQGHALGAALLAFFAFSLCASSVYLLNDLLDLNNDRRHPSKRERPLASGALPLIHGLLLAPVLLASAVLIAFVLPWNFIFVLAAYYAMTVAYSFWLKEKAMVDVMLLALLYTTRILAGAAAVAVIPSFWLLAFSMFIFLSLGMVKRFSELYPLREAGGGSLRGRGYRADDLMMLSSLGTASGYLSVLVLALYINSPDVRAMYSQPYLIWALCLLVLYWISRVWLITGRGKMHDDPVVFAIEDRTSLIIAALGLIIVLMAM